MGQIRIEATMKNLDIAVSSGFGRVPLKNEGKPAHPDAYGIGYDNGHKFGSDEHYLKQLKAYAAWRGAKETKEEMCSRPHLLGQL